MWNLLINKDILSSFLFHIIPFCFCMIQQAQQISWSHFFPEAYLQLQWYIAVILAGFSNKQLPFYGTKDENHWLQIWMTIISWDFSMVLISNIKTKPLSCSGVEKGIGDREQISLLHLLRPKESASWTKPYEISVSYLGSRTSSTTMDGDIDIGKMWMKLWSPLSNSATILRTIFSRIWLQKSCSTCSDHTWREKEGKEIIYF